jgi:alpha-tubulin suppressor-like RCC1 family protein
LAARPGVASTALIWTPAADAGSYNLYFTTLPPADVTGTQIQGVTSPFTHAGLASGRTVYYVVTAVSQAGVESAASPEASATPPSATVGAPGGVVAAAPGGTAGTASVTWTAPAGGAAPSGYAIYRSTAPVTPFNATLVGVVQAPPAGPPPLAYTDATAGGPVYYAVAAFDANGEGAFSPSSAPVNVSHSATAVISPGHTCAVLDNSAVKCWGYNSVGEPGSGSLGNIGYAAGQMGSLLPFVSLGTGRTAAAIAAGFNHTCVLLDDRTVKCWGDNAHGQLGQGDTASRGAAFSDMGDGLIALDFGPAHTVSAIAGGGYHTCVILEDRTVRCWGYNAFGQLGLGDAQDRGDNPGEMAQFLPPVNLGTGHTAKAVSAGGYHACAILEDGSVKCWGSNFYGQLGLGDVKNRGDVPGGMGAALAAVNLGTNGQGQAHTAKAVSAGGFHTCAILDDDSVKCWGQNAVGQLGLDDTANRGIGKAQMGDRLPAVNLGVGLTATSIAAGYVFTCAVLSDASTKCWGDNSYGQLGQGDTVNRGNVPGSMAALPPIALGAGGQTAAALSTNAGYHVCAALSDLTVKCWGLNLYGQLGLGDAVDRGDSAGTSVSASPAVDLGSN